HSAPARRSSDLFMAHLSDGSLAFASELKGLLAHPLLRREADPLAIEDYLTWGYVPDHRSIVKGVEKLAAGHYRLLEHDATPAAPVRWWDVSFADRDRKSTRLNSSHVKISYAVFCLKKKNDRRD